jgi:hypothetical protein
MRRQVTITICAGVLAVIAGPFVMAFQNRKGPSNVPIVNWLRSLSDLQAKGQIDVTSNIDLSIEGTLDSNCRLTQLTIKQDTGDRRLYPLAESFVSALNDSGLLTFVGYRNGQALPEGTCASEPLRLTLKTDSGFIDAGLTETTPSIPSAERISRGYNALFKAGSNATWGSANSEVLKLFNATSTQEELTIHFHASRDQFHSILSRMLSSPEIKPDR